MNLLDYKKILLIRRLARRPAVDMPRRAMLCPSLVETGARSAFTLVEVLAAMAILLILVMLMVQIFRDGAKTWLLGTRSAQDNMLARAAMDFMAHDIAQAVADSNLSMRLNSYDYPDGKVFSKAGTAVSDEYWWNDALYFVSLNNDPASGKARAARQIKYSVALMTEVVNGVTNDIPYRYRLMRTMANGTEGAEQITCYNTPYWVNSIGGKSEPVIENIASFEVWCVGVSNGPSGPSFGNVVSYNSVHDRELMKYPGAGGGYIYAPSEFKIIEGYESNQLPAYIELYVSILEEDDAVRAAALCEADNFVEAKLYVGRQAKRYAVRVPFLNRQGYGGDR